ncbi:MAG: hypothetical protein WCP61_08730 [Chitinophagia bacterium]
MELAEIKQRNAYYESIMHLLNPILTEFKEMESNNDKFTDERFGLITGSKVFVLFPKKSAEVGQRTYAKQLANQMFFKYYDEVGSWQTEHGTLSEQSALEYYQTFFDKEAKKPEFISKGNYGGSADCLTSSFGIDFKCPTTLEGWLNYMHEGISDEQFYQCQMYMMLYGLDRWKICAYLLETNRMSDMGITYPVPYEQRMIIIDVPKDETFSTELDIRSPKIIRMRDDFLEVLKVNFS